MRIIRLDVKETDSGWHLKDARFDDLNLLVGVSGVGKTKIVEAIRTLARMASQFNGELIPMIWAIEFSHDSHTYCWEGEISRGGDKRDLFSKNIPEFAREMLTIDGTVTIVRNADLLEFKGKVSPRLKTSESAISLLSGETDIRSVQSGFMLVAFIAGNTPNIAGFRLRTQQEKDSLPETIDTAAAAFSGLAKSDTVLVSRAIHAIAMWAAYLSERSADAFAVYARKRFDPDGFSRIKEHFCEVFPSVSDVTVDFTDQLRMGGDPLLLQFAIKERGYDQWILQPQMSSGMLRTLLHLFAVDAALPGSVVIVDEFENSLGKNCLPHITDSVQEHLGEVQFILTSHHPYVINQIPIKYWQLVHRRGSTVTLISARDIPALMEKSYHDAFDRLLNVDEFLQGIEITEDEASA